MDKIAACVLIPHPYHEDLFLGVSRKGKKEINCLPGGTTEEGETVSQTAIRESIEETGLRPTAIEEIFKSVDSEGWECTTFLVHYHYGKIETTEDIQIGWVTREELISGPFGDYNKRLFEVFDKRNSEE